MARVIVLSGPESGLVFPLEKTVVRIGRGSDNDLQIHDRRCSRRHAELARDLTGYVVRDLDSRNRVHVNDRLIEGERRLTNGDRIRIGDTELLVEVEGPTDGAGSPSSGGGGRATTAVSVTFVDDRGSQWGELRGSVAAGEESGASVPLEKARAQAQADPQSRFRILYQVADKLRSILELDRLLEQIVAILSEVLKPDILIVLLKDEETGELRPSALRSQEDEETGVNLSRSIVDHCVGERVAVLVSDAARDRRFAASESVARLRIRSAICSPLIHQEEVLGVVYVDTKSAFLPYRQEDLELVTGIANQAAMAIANARLHERAVRQRQLEREMDIARTIQTNLLPREAPDLEGFDVWGMSAPALQVGGDYFDYVRRGDDQLAIAIADVSGKGVPAALLAATLRASLRIFTEAPTSEDTEERVQSVLDELNRTVCRDAADDMFVSAVFGALDARGRRFVYANAGHCHPLLFTPDGQHAELPHGGVPLGVVPEIEYDVGVVDLPPGSVLVLYTDGLTDMVDDENRMFGFDLFVANIEGRLDLPARQICQGVFAAARAHRGSADQFDDCTMIVVKSLA